MPDGSSDWNEVATSVAGLALKLKMHLEQAGAADDASAARQAAKDDVRRALDSLSDAMEDGFEAVRNAVADPAVKDDVRQVGSALRDALANSFGQVSDDLRDSFGRRRGGEG